MSGRPHRRQRSAQVGHLGLELDDASGLVPSRVLPHRALLSAWRRTYVRRVTNYIGVTIALLVALTCIGGCGEPGDAQTQQACRQFRAYAGDQADGLLTPAEWREAAQDVEEDAVAGSDDAVASTSRQLLAVLTQGGSDQEEAVAITALDEACSEAGH